jgi:hypothetical protein
LDYFKSVTEYFTALKGKLPSSETEICAVRKIIQANEKRSDTESDTYILAYMRSSCVPSEGKDDERRRGVTKKGGLVTG